MDAIYTPDCSTLTYLFFDDYDVIMMMMMLILASTSRDPFAIIYVILDRRSRIARSVCQ